MECGITRKIFVNLTLDSSETIMFNQGGKHKIDIPTEFFRNFEYDEMEISFQIEKSQQGRHEFIIKEAAKHRESCDEN